MATALNISHILDSGHIDGRVDRTVGDSLFYVSLKDGTSLGFQPQDVLVKSSTGVKRFRGQSFRELGLINGARVKVFGVNDPDTPDCVVVEEERTPGIMRWLRSGI